MREAIGSFVSGNRFQNFITVIIIANAITLGLETISGLGDFWLSLLSVLDAIFVAIFIVEIVLKLIAYRLAFFKDGWNVFDFSIIAVTLLPVIDSLTALRALRILRVLRLISIVPQFKKVAQAFFDSLSGLASIGGIIGIIFYIGAVMATRLFGSAFPEWFGTLGNSLYTLFQIMTLESWSMGIVRPVMEVYPYAWAFFIPFILVTTFATLNLIIGIIVNSMQNMTDTEKQENSSDTHDLKKKIEDLEKSLKDLKNQLP